VNERGRAVIDAISGIASSRLMWQHKVNQRLIGIDRKHDWKLTFRSSLLSINISSQLLSANANWLAYANIDLVLLSFFPMDFVVSGSVSAS
jgi:hypothetical protein